MKYLELVTTIDTASRQLLGRAAATVNQFLVLRNWLVGAYIVEFEQNGDDRAKYGNRLLPRLAKDLEQRAVKGLSVQMLERTRHLYFAYPQLRPSISSSVMRKLDLAPVLQQMEKSSSVMRKSAGSITPLSANAVLHFSWTQLIELIRIDDPLKRAFYENECLKGNWSVRQLQRQIGSLLFERTGLSKNKIAVIKRAHAQEPQETIADLSRYLTVLPSAEQLQRFVETDRARIEALTHGGSSKPVPKRNRHAAKP